MTADPSPARPAPRTPVRAYAHVHRWGTLLRRVRLASIAVVLVAGCSGDRGPRPPTPAEVRATVVRLLPATLRDRDAWASDIQTALAALELDPSVPNLCSVLAVVEQESSFSPNPVVPGLARIAREEIERRAERLHVPLFVVRAALQLESPDGRTWDQRLAAVRTEKELNRIFEELVDSVPMGRRLFAGANPVRTAGPMQVSIAFAEAHASDRAYPYARAGSIRDEVFTRRGGLYFGIAHLLGYPASYERPLYRFADFNAGWYASRNAAFQNAVAIASGIGLDLDGDLIRHRPVDDGHDVGATERAVRTLAPGWDMTDAQVRRALAQSTRLRFEKTELYERVFELADRRAGRRLPRAMVPRIRLQSPKISRKLTTEWFATRVDRRYQRCVARAQAPRG